MWDSLKNVVRAITTGVTEGSLLTFQSNQWKNANSGTYPLVPSTFNIAHKYHDDIIGDLQTALVGVTTYTMRGYRNTGIVMPHVARGDVFSMKFQMPHRKYLSQALDSVHIHFIPLGSHNGNIVISWAWGWFNHDEVVPDTLPNTSSTTIPLVTTDQYKQKLSLLITNLTPPTGEQYSSILYVKCTRETTGDTWGTEEFALAYMDAHFPADRLGSYNEASDPA